MEITSSKILAQMLSKGSVSFLLKAVGALALLVSQILVSRLLGAEAAGHYYLGISLLMVLSVFARTGYDYVAIKFMAPLDHKAVDASRYTVFFIVCVSLTSILLGITLAGFAGSIADLFNFGDNREVITVVAMTIVPFSLLTLVGAFFQSRKNMVLMHFSHQFGVAFFLIPVLFYWWFNSVFVEPIDIIVSYFLASCGVLTLGGLLWRYLYLNAWLGLPGRDRQVEFAKTALPIWGAVFMGVLMNQIATLMLGHYSTSDDVSVYANASRTAIVVALILQAVNSIVAPQLAQGFSSSDLNRVRRISQVATALNTGFGLPVVLFLLFFAPDVMLLFGSEFVAGADVLRLLVLVQLFNLVTGPVGWLLTMGGEEQTLLKINFTGLSLVVICCVVLIPIYGAFGAVLAEFVGLFVRMVVGIYVIRRKMGFLPFNVLDLLGSRNV